MKTYHADTDRKVIALVNRRFAAIWMNKVEPWSRCEFSFRITQHSLPGRIYQLEVTVEAADAQHIERHLEQPAKLFLGARDRWNRILLFFWRRHLRNYTRTLTVAQAT